MAPKAAPEASNAAPTTTEASSRKEAPGIVKRSSAYMIDPVKITRREGWNPRFDFGEIDQLAISIKANGMLNPIRVKRLAKPTDAGHVFELIDGDRRLTACEALIKKDAAAFPEGIPAIIVDKAQDDLTSLIQMFEANSGKVFLPMEEAAAYKRMRDAGMTIKQICAAVGRKQVHVTETLNLLSADAELQQAAEKGEVSKTDAKRIATVAKGNKDKQRELTNKAKAAGKDKTKRRALKSDIDKAHREEAAKRGKKLKIRALSDAQLSDIGSSMAEHLLTLLEAQDIAVDSDLVAMIRKDPMLTIAYTTGALDALKVAAGGDNNLKL
jgi:ParB family chromosome partitioning protein